LHIHLSCTEYVYVSVDFPVPAASIAMKPVVAALKPREVSYVGFGNIPNQVFRRAVKLGFDFTLMVVGTITMDRCN
jgi:septin 7